MLRRHETRHIRALGALCVCALVAACGLKGPLYLQVPPSNFPALAPTRVVQPVCITPTSATAVAAAAAAATKTAVPAASTRAAPTPPGNQLPLCLPVSSTAVTPAEASAPAPATAASPPRP